jgi:threonine synthase
MQTLGVIDRLPRLLGVQAEQINPLAYAFEHDALPPQPTGTTIADSINVRCPRNWRKAVRALRESHGVPLAVADDAILDAMRLAGRHGVYAEPAAAAALAGVVSAVGHGIVTAHDRVLVMITGSGLKDTRSAIRAGGQPIAVAPDVSAVHELLMKSHQGADSQGP